MELRVVVTNSEESVAVVAVGGHVHRPGRDLLADHDRAISAQPLRSSKKVERSALLGSESGEAGGCLCPAIGSQTDTTPVRIKRQQLHHATKRIGSVEITRRAADDLNPVDCGLRNPVPVHPASERVVEGQAVGQHQRAARSRPGDPAQRHTLCGGIRDSRRRAPKQAEARRVPEHVVERAASGREDLGRADNRRT